MQGLEFCGTFFTERGIVMSTFSKITDLSGYVADTVKLIALSHEHQPDVKVGWDSVVCLIYNSEGEVVFSWLDDQWTLMHDDENIIADLDAELSWLVMQEGVIGEVTVVVGQLKNADGVFEKAYTCTCDTQKVVATLSA